MESDLLFSRSGNYGHQCKFTLIVICFILIAMGILTLAVISILNFVTYQILVANAIVLFQQIENILNETNSDTFNYLKKF